MNVDHLRIEYGLTGSEARLMLCLSPGELCSKEHLYNITADAPRENGHLISKLLHVKIHHLRKKLKPRGLAIENVWGRGYRLLEASA